MTQSVRLTTADLKSSEDWIRRYDDLAGQHIQRNPHIVKYNERRASLQECLVADCNTMIASKANDLRNSGSYSFNKYSVALASLIPMGKSASKYLGGKSFAKRVLTHYGIDNSSIATDLNPLSKAVNEAALELADQFSNEILGDVATDAAAELIHAAPILGQLISCINGYEGMREQQIKMIERCAEVATRYHTNIMIPTVINHNIPEPEPEPCGETSCGEALSGRTSSGQISSTFWMPIIVIAAGLLIYFILDHVHAGSTYLAALNRHSGMTD